MFVCVANVLSSYGSDEDCDTVAVGIQCQRIARSISSHGVAYAIPSLHCDSSIASKQVSCRPTTVTEHISAPDRTAYAAVPSSTPNAIYISPRTCCQLCMSKSGAFPQTPSHPNTKVPKQSSLLSHFLHVLLITLVSLLPS